MEYITFWKISKKCPSVDDDTLDTELNKDKKYLDTFWLSNVSVRSLCSTHGVTLIVNSNLKHNLLAEVILIL